MLIRLVLYLVMLFAGIFIGYIEISHKKLLDRLDKLQMIALLILLFVMGIRIGADENVVKSIGTLGAKAIIISLSSIVCSVLFIYVYRFVKKINKQGEKI